MVAAPGPAGAAGGDAAAAGEVAARINCPPAASPRRSTAKEARAVLEGDGASSMLGGSGSQRRRLPWGRGGGY